MKLYKLRYISILAIASILSVSCDDDDPISAGEGDPSNENVVNLEATVSADQTFTGEGNTIGFSVVLPQSFASDATVTARITLDNGSSSLGTATVTAGATTGTGSITLPPDDSVVDGATIEGIADAGTLSLIAILLDELESGTAYTLSSNDVSLGLYPDTLPAAGGLNVLMDWVDPVTFDLDMQIIDRAFTSIFESSGSSDRFESDLFQNAGRADGVYDIYIRNFSASPTADVDFILLLTQPDGTLDVLRGVLPAGSPAGGARIPVATFEKTTDVVTGVTTYINLALL